MTDELNVPLHNGKSPVAAGIAVSAIQNLHRGRLKHVERISIQIAHLYASFLERQIAVLEAEIVFARAREPARDFSAVEALLARAKAALEGSDTK